MDYRPRTPAGARAGGNPAAAEIAATFQFHAEAVDYFVGTRDLDRGRALNPRLQPLGEWLAANADALAASARPDRDL